MNGKELSQGRNINISERVKVALRELDSIKDSPNFTEFQKFGSRPVTQDNYKKFGSRPVTQDNYKKFGSRPVTQDNYKKFGSRPVTQSHLSRHNILLEDVGERRGSAHGSRNIANAPKSLDLSERGRLEITQSLLKKVYTRNFELQSKVNHLEVKLRAQTRRHANDFGFRERPKEPIFQNSHEKSHLKEVFQLQQQAALISRLSDENKQLHKEIAQMSAKLKERAFVPSRRNLPTLADSEMLQQYSKQRLRFSSNLSERLKILKDDKRMSEFTCRVVSMMEVLLIQEAGEKEASKLVCQNDLAASLKREEELYVRNKMLELKVAEMKELVMEHEYFKKTFSDEGITEVVASQKDNCMGSK
eukprot:463751_1